MIIAVIRTLSSSDNTDTSILVIIILSVRVDTPWNSASVIRRHENMSTSIELSSAYMRSVPANKQYDDATSSLSPVRWRVEIVIIFNEAGRDAFLNHDWIHTILSPAITTYFTTTPLYILAASPRHKHNSPGLAKHRDRGKIPDRHTHPIRPIPR
jgi:hypothetical protein